MSEVISEVMPVTMSTTAAAAVSGTRELSMMEAIREAIVQEMRSDPRVILLGEDVGKFGGAFHVTHGLLEEFGPNRVWDTPISEAGFMGLGVGAALTGLRPIVELQYADFIFCAMDQVVNEAAKLRLMSGGQACVPLVIRAPQGATGRGAQHSQSVEAWFMHTPGMKVVMPSNPYDAKGLLISAMRDDNPVLFLEHKMLYGSASPGGGQAVSDAAIGRLGRSVPEETYSIPLGKADIKRAGRDVTIIATAVMVHRALAVAEQLAEEGIEIEVIDLRTLVPLDVETIVTSLRHTHRAIVVSEDTRRAGVAAELVATIMDHGFDELDAPVIRVCADDTPIPFAPAAQDRAIPNGSDILAAIRRVLE
jgi:pyruvate dehydrogenase E1 component beta subunit